MSKIQCVYRIECLYESVTEIYVGSSIDLHRRISEHKSRCNNSNSKEYNLKGYEFIRARGGWKFWKVSIIKEYPGWTKEQLLIPEQIDLLKPMLNSYNAYTTLKQKVDQSKNYKELNKDKIVDQSKNYYELNKDKINEQSKNYYELNKDEIKERGREYHEKHKDKRNVNASIKINCDKCGSIVRKGDIATHKKTKKCINFIPQNLNMIII